MTILTARETRLLAFVLGALLLGAAVQAWRESRSAQPALERHARP